MGEVFDVIVVGSGPSGSMAAAALVEQGLRVLMLDGGEEDKDYGPLIPYKSFSEIRRTDPRQAEYFLGKDFEGLHGPALRVGSQLTPPRRFITRGTEERFLPVESENFFPIQSLALGGLGAGWGAVCFTYEAEELRRIGIVDEDMARCYEEAAGAVGISCDKGDDAYDATLRAVRSTLPPLEIDANCAGVLQAYRRRREAFARRGFALGKPALAVLSRDRGERKANPYHDMDFWSDAGGSVFRPRYLIDSLKQAPNFTYRPGVVVEEFQQTPLKEVEVGGFEMADGTRARWRGRRLILCAGAINSARIALRSLGLEGRKTPLLCNSYTLLPCIHLRMLGRANVDRRYSLAQLVGVCGAQDESGDPLVAQFYSYRSLLLFRLVQQMPLPVWAGLLAARLLASSLTIVAALHPDSPQPDQWMRLTAGRREGSPVVEFNYEPPLPVVEARRRAERRLRRLLAALGCVPLARVEPGGRAASMHYAGTIPCSADRRGFGCDANGRLHGLDLVYVADGSSWNHLPAKGPTLTLMANARRVARRVARSLAPMERSGGRL